MFIYQPIPIRWAIYRASLIFIIIIIITIIYKKKKSMAPNKGVKFSLSVVRYTFLNNTLILWLPINLHEHWKHLQMTRASIWSVGSLMANPVSHAEQAKLNGLLLANSIADAEVTSGERGLIPHWYAKALRWTIALIPAFVLVLPALLFLKNQTLQLEWKVKVAWCTSWSNESKYSWVTGKRKLRTSLDAWGLV